MTYSSDITRPFPASAMTAGDLTLRHNTIPVTSVGHCESLNKMTTIGKLTILGPTQPDKYRHAMVRVQCDCGSHEFVARKTAVESGNTKSCGCVAHAHKKPAPPAPRPTAPSPLLVEGPPALTPAWYAQQIAGKEAAAVAAERRANDLEQKLASQECTDLETHKQWNTEATTARKLRQEIARLKSAKDKAETGEKKDTRTQVEITRDKIAALRGGR